MEIQSEYEVPKKMRAIPFTKSTPNANDLKIVNDWPVPEIQEDEILIKVKAFGVNFADTLGRKGQYPDAPPFPFISGYEASGIVVQVGSATSKFRVGQKVISFISFGGYAEYAKTKEDFSVPLPDGWSYAQGAAIIVTYLTAYHCIFHTGVVSPGDRILIHACAGGVGLAAVQLAKIAKLEIFGTCGSDEKVELLRKKGVDHPINYSTHTFENEINSITKEEGVDIVIDSIGGSYFKRSLSVLRANGRVVGIGAAGISQRSLTSIFSTISQAISMLTLNSVDLVMNAKTFYGVNLLKVVETKPKLLRDTFSKVMDMFEKGELEVGDVHELDWSEASKAHSMLENRKTTGKLVLSISD